MQVDFSQPITDFDGNPLPAETDQNGSPVGEKKLTLGLAAARSLCQPDTGDNPDKRALCGFLANETYQNKKLDLSLQEATLIVQKIGRAYGPMVVAAAYRMLGQKVNSEVAGTGTPTDGLGAPQ